VDLRCLLLSEYIFSTQIRVVRSYKFLVFKRLA
jgi:hypothetical protein